MTTAMSSRCRHRQRSDSAPTPASAREDERANRDDLTNENDSDDDFGPIIIPPPLSAAAAASQSKRAVKPRRPALPLTRPLNFPRDVPPPSSTKLQALYAQYQYHYMHLPSQYHYEQSYQHATAITHLTLTNTHFVLTASVDGTVKFWKKVSGGIEFVRQYKSHIGRLVTLAVDRSGLNGVSIGEDSVIKFYDVQQFDTIHFATMPFRARSGCWVHSRNGKPTVCVSSNERCELYFYHNDSTEPIRITTLMAVSATITSASTGTYTDDSLVDESSFDSSNASSNNTTPISHDASSFTSHTHIIHLLTFHPALNLVVSVDISGMIDYWSTLTFSLPSPPDIAFTSKLDTDLYSLVKRHTHAHNESHDNDSALSSSLQTSLTFNHSGTLFVTTGLDSIVRLWKFSTGKIIKQFDDSLTIAQSLQQSGHSDYVIDSIDYGRRMAIEKSYQKEYQQHASLLSNNAVFDDSGNFLLFSSMIGIKVVNIQTNTLMRVIGKDETGTGRLLTLALFQGIPTDSAKSEAAKQSGAIIKTDTLADSDNDSAKKKSLEDPSLFAISWQKDRFYIFTSRPPSESRDVLNERPTGLTGNSAVKPSLLSSTGSGKAGSVTAIIHTSLGDLTCQLHQSQTPKTVENFITLSRRGYYNGCIFHRVIPQFMVQTGDPTATGRGGISMWGRPFEDEIVRELKHDSAGVLAMANAGPATNNSQFFLTTAPAPWLDGKHTVFGRVVRGLETVMAIESVECVNTRPLEPPKIINIEIQ